MMIWRGSQALRSRLNTGKTITKRYRSSAISVINAFSWPSARCDIWRGTEYVVSLMSMKRFSTGLFPYSRPAGSSLRTYAPQANGV